MFEPFIDITNVQTWEHPMYSMKGPKPLI